MPRGPSGGSGGNHADHHDARAERLDALRRALSQALRRIDRRLTAVRGDLERAAAADDTARRAQLFVVAASRAPRGASALQAVDWSSGEAREIEMKVDPARSAQAQLEAVFLRARRLKEGARIAQGRLQDAERARAALAEIVAEVEALAEQGRGARGESVGERAGGATLDLSHLEARAKAAAPRDFRLVAPSSERGGRARGPAQQAPLPPYRTFLSSSGARILVGKGAEKNDELTWHVARPHHLWLHAKNRTGAHVIVPLQKGHSCPADLLVDAAHLAAHFSDARGEDLVEVQYASRRHLRKPRGSPPGLVVVDREKVMALRRQEELLRALLEREDVSAAPDIRDRRGSP